MQLLRTGSKSNHGASSVFDAKNPRISWDNTSKAVRLTISRIPDIDQPRATYDYDLSLSIEDIQKIIGSLVEKGIPDCQVDISQKFSTQTDKLLKLMLCSAGFV